MKNLFHSSTSLCLGVLALLFVTFTGCNRSGCTYPQASNYNANATEDDGSCYFYGTSVVYVNQATSDSLANDGAQFLQIADDLGYTYYIYGGQFTNLPPECFDYNWPIFQSNELFDQKTLHLTDQTGHDYGTFKMPVIGGECTNFRLTGLNWK